MVATEVEEFESHARVYAQLHFRFSHTSYASFIVAVEIFGLHLCKLHTSES